MHRFTNYELKNIIKCKNQIPHLFRPLKTYAKYCVRSYGGKHEVEKYRNTSTKGNNYISNGEFIAAMILNGYVPKKYELNCEFKAKKINQKL